MRNQLKNTKFEISLNNMLQRNKLLAKYQYKENLENVQENIINILETIQY